MEKIKVEGKMIGRKIIVSEAENKSLIGITGRVIDETKNLFIVKTEKGEKRLIKKQVELKIR